MLCSETSRATAGTLHLGGPWNSMCEAEPEDPRQFQEKVSPASATRAESFDQSAWTTSRRS